MSCVSCWSPVSYWTRNILAQKYLRLVLDDFYIAPPPPPANKCCKVSRWSPVSYWTRNISHKKYLRLVCDDSYIASPPPPPREQMSEVSCWSPVSYCTQKYIAQKYLRLMCWMASDIVVLLTPPPPQTNKCQKFYVEVQSVIEPEIYRSKISQTHVWWLQHCCSPTPPPPPPPPPPPAAQDKYSIRSSLNMLVREEHGSFEQRATKCHTFHVEVQWAFEPEIFRTKKTPLNRVRWPLHRTPPPPWPSANKCRKFHVDVQ